MSVGVSENVHVEVWWGLGDVVVFVWGFGGGGVGLGQGCRGCSPSPPLSLLCCPFFCGLLSGPQLVHRSPITPRPDRGPGPAPTTLPRHCTRSPREAVTVTAPVPGTGADTEVMTGAMTVTGRVAVARTGPQAPRQTEGNRGSTVTEHGIHSPGDDPGLL